MREIYRSPVNSPHKGQWRGALVFSLICAWINGWMNNREANDLRRHRAHYDVIVMLRLKVETAPFWSWTLHVAGNFVPYYGSVLVSWCAKNRHILTAPEHLLTAPEDLITAPEYLPTAPEHLLTAPEHFRNWSVTLSKLLRNTSNCSGRLITVPEDYNCYGRLTTVPEHLLTAPEHFRSCSVALTNCSGTLVGVPEDF